MNTNNSKFFIIEEINGEFFNVGEVNSEQEARAEIEERIANDEKNGRNTREKYSYSENRYDK